MRALVVTLLSALLVAGCSAPAAEEDEPEPASVDDPAGQTPTPSPTATTPAPTPSPTPAPTPTPSPTPTAETPAPVVLVPWNLTAQARVGWLVAAGAGGAGAPSQGQKDAEHCPDAAFGVPAGAKMLRVTLAGEPLDPDAQSAGSYVVTLTDPAGTVIEMQPLMENAPGADASDREFVGEMPAPGDWKLHAEPVGPAIQQVWTATLDVTGESETPPTAIIVAVGC